MFAGGLALFTLSSLTCGLATSSIMLNISRAVQGVGGAIMFATSLALIASAFSGQGPGTAFGIYGAVVGGAVAVGPLVGGAITSGIGWRWIFFVNVPIGIFAVIVTLAKVVESRDPNTRRIDWIGFVTFSAALFMPPPSPWCRGTVPGGGEAPRSKRVSWSASAVSMAIFLVAEWRQKDPMLDLNLFRRPAVIGVSLAAFTLSASIFAMFLYMTLYIQDDLGYGPFAAGIRFLPLTLMAFIVAPFAGKLTVRVRIRFLMGLGLLLVAGGCLLMTAVSATSGWTVLLPGFIVAGAGIGMVNPTLASSAVSVVPPSAAAWPRGRTSTARQVGIATGIAGLGAVFQSQIVAKTTAALQASAVGRGVAARGGSDLHAALTAGQVQAAAAAVPLASARQALLNAYHVGFASTLDHLMAIGAIIAFIGSVAAFALIRQRDFVVSGPPVPPSQPAGEPVGPGAPEASPVVA